jgi:UDP-2,4-diacetamido-2,4,6-trideoxy-beta-L-altropyranose hydrolase
MNILIRCDASISIGSGHVMRCLTIARALREIGHHCVFLTKSHRGNLISSLRHEKFDVFTITHNTTQEYVDEAQWLGGTQEEDATESHRICQLNHFVPDLLIIDHYALDKMWEQQMRQSFPRTRLIVFDDLANRKHDCDILIDSSPGRLPQHYTGLITEKCLCLTGPLYALMQQKFNTLREQAMLRRKQCIHPKRILITMGGVDIDNIAGKVLIYIEKILLDVPEVITLVVGKNYPHLEKLKTYSAVHNLPVNIKVNVNNMAELMLEHDIAIGALGVTFLERCALGLPGINIAIAANQQPLVERLQNQGFLMFKDTSFSASAFSSAWSFLLSNYQHSVEIAFALGDGKGMERVITLLTENETPGRLK